MKIDMHFYGTYAIARLAGFESEPANIIATAAQFVDDATDNNSEKNEQNEMLFAISTAHHNAVAGALSFAHKEAHRLVWVPFHFYPGGKGDTLGEKLICVKDSGIVNAMFENHLSLSGKAYWLHLLGIASHVYLDTFSHYGFSGIVSNLNEIKSSSIKLQVKEKNMLEYVTAKAEGFWNKFKGEFAGAGSRGLGHGAVATFPDRPYLSWEFEYEQARYGNGTGSGIRNNQDTYLEGLQKLHEKLSRAACKRYAYPKPLGFPEDEVEEILALECKGYEREAAWRAFIKKRLGEEVIKYHGDKWNHEKDRFDKTISPNMIKDCYRFHQAAAYHRWYTLKDLLPEKDIYVM